MKRLSFPRPPSRVPRALLLPWVLIALASSGAISIASAQNSGAPINPIASFHLQEAGTDTSWSQTNATVDAGTGNSIITFGDGAAGTSTMVWSANAGTLVSWSISYGGATQYFIDATAQGQPGAFLLASGTFGSNNVLSINGHAYVPSGNVLQPAQSKSLYYLNAVVKFVYGGATMQFVSCGTDYAGRVISTFANGSVNCTAVTAQALQIYWPNGTFDNYTLSTQGVYTYQANSTAQNLLTQVNGFPLTIAGETLALPVPLKSFVWNGKTYLFASLSFTGTTNSLINWSYGVAMGGGSLALTSDVNGLFQSLQIYVYSPSYMRTSVTPGTVANTYQVNPASAASQFSAFNGVPYAAQGAVLVPQGPVNGFTYGGNAYQFTGYTQSSNGNWLAQYQTSSSPALIANAEYSPSTDALVKLTVNATSGGAAIYVDGATVGRPGSYVWSTSSTATNQLSAVNSTSYNSDGDAALPTTAQTTTGVFDIEGNFMNLGSWYSDPTHVGLSLAYYDGQSASVPSKIEFTASRPLTAWTWDAASADGTLINPVMQVDETSRLLLFAPADPQATSATVPTPAVVLDPNLNGVSRFDGAVRISPQGDLLMGEFTSEPAPTPAQ